jgi:hypothetical protein
VARNSWTILAGKPKEKKPLGSSVYRQESNIKMDCRKIMCEGVNWIQPT